MLPHWMISNRITSRLYQITVIFSISSFLSDKQPHCHIERVSLALFHYLVVTGFAYYLWFCYALKIHEMGTFSMCRIFPHLLDILYTWLAELFIRKESNLFCIEIRFRVLFTSSWRFNAMDIKRFSLMQFRYNLDIGFCEGLALIPMGQELLRHEKRFSFNVRVTHRFILHSQSALLALCISYYHWKWNSLMICNNSVLACSWFILDLLWSIRLNHV